MTTVFSSVRGVLHAEEVALTRIAEQFGTPTYVYSRSRLSENYQRLARAAATAPHHICYAVKANGSLALLQVLASLGCDFDAGSVGELARVLSVGVKGDRIILSGVGKRDDEIEAALRAGVLYLTVESEDEIESVAAIAARLGRRAPVTIRFNPDVDARTHPHISTGLRDNKFGVPLARARALAMRAKELAHVDLCGVTCHIGSQIVELAPFREAAQHLARAARELLQLGLPLRFVGIGGGLGIAYREDDTPPTPEAYVATVREELEPLGLTLVFEPGRAIAADAGLLLSRVVRRKKGSERDFVIIDAGMNDLVRPALYGAYHRIEAVATSSATSSATGSPSPSADGVSTLAGEPEMVDVVGPVCETSDTFGRARPFPRVNTGDLVAIRDAGAYGMVMSSTYNGRLRPAEVLVEAGQVRLIRKRDTLADQWHNEALLDGSSVPAMLGEALRDLRREAHE